MSRQQANAGPGDLRCDLGSLRRKDHRCGNGVHDERQIFRSVDGLDRAAPFRRLEQHMVPDIIRLVPEQVKFPCVGPRIPAERVRSACKAWTQMRGQGSWNIFPSPPRMTWSLHVSSRSWKTTSTGEWTRRFASASRRRRASTCGCSVSRRNMAVPVLRALSKIYSI